jgi:hypothetical protein
MDWELIATAGVGALGGMAAWSQTRRAARRDDFAAITTRLDQELKDERTQRKLLTSFVLDLLRWAHRVEPTSQAGQPPDPPPDLDLSPWRR